MLSLEAPRVPALDVNTARRLLHAHFGVAGALEPLPSERDQNFRVTGADGVARVFKIASSDEQAQTFDMQAALLRHVESVDPTLPVPRVQSALSGSDTVTVEQAGQKLQLRLVSHVAGAPLASMPRTHEQLHQVGRAVGRLSRALRSFGHAGAHRELDWDLRRALASRGRLHNIADTTTRRLVETALDGFEQRVAPAIPTLRHSVVHGDPNDWNVLVDPVAPDGVTGIIDVGDALFSITIADLAIACAYGMLGTSSPVLAAAETIRGFHAEQPVHEHEIELLPDLIRGRLCTSLTMAAARRSRSGEANTYWFVSEQPAWALLEQLAAVNRQHAVGLFRRACGLEASPGARRISTWIGENADRFAPVVGRPLSQYETRRLDWANPNDPVVAATSNHDLCGADRAYDAQRKEHGFEIGIGAWGEARAIYTAPVFGSKVISGGRRNVHLGLDIFTDAGVELHSPLPGRVVATANCERPQDYGGVLLLEHRTGDGLAFRTLWGHLEPESLQSLRPGQAVAAGDTVALLGSRDVNGGWVPHLHLQIVCTGEDDPAEIIGVGEPELLDLWTELYPDPTRLAGLHPEALTNADGTGAALAQRRRGLLGANLSLSYRRPLHIVRGTDVWLIDAAGRAYLDCYNNVAHVGHGHPRVVDAIARQAAVLNTNTRYLNERILEYAERLTATLPSPLSVCFFVCSGSEANELALRLARAHTGRTDVIVLDWAYHGSTTSLVEISPYKYKKAGGEGRAPHVHELPVPDPYRAPIDWPSADVGRRYAQKASAILNGGVRPGCFIAETIPSCAGQVFVPSGFFRDVFAAIRAVGGVCVLDEVQVGFGRIGSTMWAFEEHDVVPDIVTLGKPIGNGHPLGAVVTTPAIAASFANGIEYFNTFGGNPVSCAAGLEVLNVVRDERLLENATARGRQLLVGLRTLQSRHECIGDVRGRGLFLGVELVTDRLSKTHATQLAQDVVNRCRSLGVLLGTDGPLDNVLKIRPPMTFRPEHGEQLLATLERALAG